MRMYARLRRTHPRIGKAMYGAYFESDLTGEHPGQQVTEILNHDDTVGTCDRCGAREHRTYIRARMLVGPNAGLVHRWWSKDCSASCGGASSNYTPPWSTRPTVI